MVSGNDRLVALTSTFGYTQIRQDETGPKLLNDFDPPRSQFGGGLVYVIDTKSRELLATNWYSGQPDANRTFGIGYARRGVGSTGGGLSLRHELYAPFGSDPVVTSTANITNAGSTARKVSVIEVWGTRMYQQMVCESTGGGCAMADRRVRISLFFSSFFSTLTSCPPLRRLFSSAAKATEGQGAHPWLGLYFPTVNLAHSLAVHRSPTPRGALFFPLPGPVFVAR